MECFDDAVRSPCVRVCRFDEGDQQCLGCLRTRDEVRDWFRLSKAAQQGIVDALPQRMRDRTARRRAAREAAAG